MDTVEEKIRRRVNFWGFLKYTKWRLERGYPFRMIFWIWIYPPALVMQYREWCDAMITDIHRRELMTDQEKIDEALRNFGLE